MGQNHHRSQSKCTEDNQLVMFSYFGVNMYLPGVPKILIMHPVVLEIFGDIAFVKLTYKYRSTNKPI